MGNPQDSVPVSEPQGATPPPGLLQVLWGRKALIVLGAIVGVTIGALYYAQRAPLYESSAQVLVEKKMPELPAQGVDAFWSAEDYLSTQERVVSSPIIIGKAVKEQELSKLRSFQGMSEQQVVGSIKGSLKVTRETSQNGSSGPSILNLVYRGSDPDDCREVLAAILTSYQAYLDETYLNTNQKTLKSIVKTCEQLVADIKALRTKERKLQDEGPLMIGKDGYTVEETELATILSRLSALRLQRGELGSKISQIEQAIRLGQDPTLLIEAAEGKSLGTATPTGSAALSDTSIDVQLMPQLLHLRDLESRYGAGHPDVRELRNQIEAAREILKGANVSSRRSSIPSALHQSAALETCTLSVGLLATPSDQGPLLAAAAVASMRSIKAEVVHYLQMVKAQLQDVEVTITVLQEMGDKESKIVHNLAGYRNELAAIGKDIADKQQYLGTLNRVRDDQKTLGGKGGYVATTLAPPAQGGQIEPRPAPIFTMALLLGLAAGVALAWVAEATDKSFRTPDEVRRRLGLAVVGHVPRILPDPEALRQHEAGALAIDPSICAFYQSKSLEAEAFRGVRTTLYFSGQHEGTKIIQVTSPNMGDGKTTLATNLAVSIAQSGKKILLIDADFRRPKLHRMFGVRAPVGLATVIQHDTELSDAIQTTPVPNLSILPCGPRPSNPAELLTSPRFKEVLETLRDKYDLILVDTPPLLAVSDPSVVASQVDGVLLTIRVSKNGRPSAERARDILAAIGANVLGVIVNGIGNRGQEGYGAAHYGYQYQYQYAYEPTDNRTYYQEGEKESPAHTNGVASPNGFHNHVNGEPVDPDVVDVAAPPARPESTPLPRKRVPGSRHKMGEKLGVVAGLKRWLRTTLWH